MGWRLMCGSGVIEVLEAGGRSGEFADGEHMKKEKSIADVNHLVVFKKKSIRRTLHNNEWCFSITDVVEALTDSSNPRRYWSDLKSQLHDKEGFSELYGKIVQLKLASSDGKRYETDCANTETLFRVIQSIPSPKAEPFKRPSPQKLSQL